MLYGSNNIVRLVLLLERVNQETQFSFCYREKYMLHSKSISPQTKTTAQPVSIDWKLCVLYQKRKQRKFAMSSEFQKNRPWSRIEIPCTEFAAFQ